ncbi:hypothetical protein H4582DRAFT_1602579 [Lactarius indigo]|nr:hypothetical protein H4582DRAFT_1602579 [Lactarius indigo]
MLIRRYLWTGTFQIQWFMRSLQDRECGRGQYRRNRGKYAEHYLSLLRSKIGELHPFHRAALETVAAPLACCLPFRSENTMVIKALAAQFCYTILHGNAVLQDGVHVKTTCCNSFSLTLSKHLVLEDLIRDPHTPFDERPSPSPVSLPYVKTTSTLTVIYGSCLSPKLP